MASQLQTFSQVVQNRTYVRQNVEEVETTATVKEDTNGEQSQ